jgi:hypothetical protein
VRSAPHRSQLEIASLSVALVFATVLLVDSLRLYLRYDGFGADVAVPFFTAVPVLAAAAWAALAPHGRRIALAAGMAPSLFFVLSVGAPTLMYVAPLGVLLLLLVDASLGLQPAR